MQRNDVSRLIDRALRGAPDTPIAERCESLRRARSLGSVTARRVDERVIAELDRLRSGFTDLAALHERLRASIDRTGEPPLHPAIVIGLDETPAGPLALVQHGPARLVVTLDAELATEIAPGDAVLLGPDRTTVARRSPFAAARCGETAIFERALPDGRLVLRRRDEAVLVEAAASLEEASLEAGDLVRWSESATMALERVPRSTASPFFLEDAPAETFADIGGMDHVIEELRASIGMHRFEAAAVQKWRLRRKGSVLLVGPPGNGKTLLARALANWLGAISPARRSRFMNVRPGALNSLWYGQSEANYRELFRVARDTGAEHRDVPVVIFFDEVDTVGARRGAALAHTDDRVQNAFLAELDGLAERGNVLVVAATNRHDMLDPALVRPGRLGDHIVTVPRPDQAAARQILEKHLPVDIPYARGGGCARDELIDLAVSRFFPPDGDGYLATVVLRDGRTHDVAPGDLISGAAIANVVRRALERACRREIAGGAVGLSAADLSEAIDGELRQAAGALTPGNCRNYLMDVPGDVAVLRVDRAAPKRSASEATSIVLTPPRVMM
ncbi:MAG: ATP-binding protein [Acidobacteria bacterium]|nr:ATP-binding protein [Acidobacteriota bacterium]